MTIVGPLTPGTHLGAYEVGILLGSGGMGKVYKARDVRLGRPVAIKLLSEALVQDPQARRYVEREAKAISRLNHPHICTLYDIGHHEGLDYLVMEFLAGETVREQLERGPFTPDNVIRYGIEIAEALSEAHRCGLLHGDLKPSNVMITANGAKVLDFGLARPLGLPRREHDASSTGNACVFVDRGGWHGGYRLWWQRLRLGNERQRTGGRRQLPWWPVLARGCVEREGRIDRPWYAGRQLQCSNDINDRGAVVGVSSLPQPDASAAFLWTETRGMINLGRFSPLAVNAHGQITSERDMGSTIPGTPAHVFHAVSWTEAAGIVDLGTAGFVRSSPVALNNRGGIVGYLDNGPLLWPMHPFLWTEAG